jgi:DNA/RNA-binding domain of Phe-tRNA-synthetase-like protein
MLFCVFIFQGKFMKAIPQLHRDQGLEPDKVRVALVWGFDLQGCPKTESEPAHLSQLLERVRAAGEGFLSGDRKAAVRDMLRFGSYKPAGRGKPSSEYLLSAALEGAFPLVNAPVDVNNAVSLESGYPASIFDLDLCGESLLLRRGVAGEAYIFNPSGQVMDVKDLLCVCRAEKGAWVPCGNPVKDAMHTKTRENTRRVAAVIYAPAAESRVNLEAAAARFAELLRRDCGAGDAGWFIPE